VTTEVFGTRWPVSLGTFVRYRTDGRLDARVRSLREVELLATLRFRNVIALGALFGGAAMTFVFFFGAQSKDLSGPWICYGLCQIVDGIATVEQDGINITFKNEAGQISRGRWVYTDQVIALDWERGLLGDLSFGGRVIQWHNPTRWVRPTRCFFTNRCI
jgi:hypothetical protein